MHPLRHNAPVRNDVIRTTTDVRHDAPVLGLGRARVDELAVLRHSIAHQREEVGIGKSEAATRSFRWSGRTNAAIGREAGHAEQWHGSCGCGDGELEHCAQSDTHG